MPYAADTMFSKRSQTRKSVYSMIPLVRSSSTGETVLWPEKSGHLEAGTEWVGASGSCWSVEIFYILMWILINRFMHM